VTNVTLLKLSSFWEEFNGFQLQLREFKVQRTSVNNRYDVVTQQLEQLKTCNVLQDVFRVSFDGNFATINGCRLGRLQNVPVSRSSPSDFAD
jgi:beclin 1